MVKRADLALTLAGAMRNKNNKIKKAKPPYWRIVQLIRKLRLKYQEHNKGESSFYITVPTFGLLFKFSRRQHLTAYADWDIVDVNLAEYEINPIDFGRNLMWLLISKGYMAYLRGQDGAHSKIFRHFLINEGWGRRIIDKRLELYNGEAKHAFMIKLNKQMKDKPVHFVLSYYPTFFDYLW